MRIQRPIYFARIKVRSKGRIDGETLILEFRPERFLRDLSG